MSKTYLPYEPDQQLLLPAALQKWLPDDHLAYFISDVVGLVRLNCELFAGKSLSKGQVGSPWLSPRAFGPPSLEAQPFHRGLATPHPTNGHKGSTAPIIVDAPGEDKTTASVSLGAPHKTRTGQAQYCQCSP